MAPTVTASEGRIRVTLSITEEAARILEESAGSRGRGDLVSRLVEEFGAEQARLRDRRTVAEELREIARLIEADEL